MELPKYSKLEIERRWLIDPRTVLDLSGMASRLIEDWYIDGARLRLRRESIDAAPPSIWKLCKKYDRPQAYQQPIVNIYLDPEEFETLRKLPSRAITKRRYGISLKSPLKVDVFEGELYGHRSCEFELESFETVANFEPPLWVGPEITDDPRFSGGALAQTSFEQLNRVIQSVIDASEI